MRFFRITLIILFFSSLQVLAEELYAIGANFKIPATQEVEFVALKKTDEAFFKNKTFPRILDLRPDQSPIKFQGQRGACTYFVVSSLIESLIKKKYRKELDISEEYLAWAAKVKGNMRSKEEDSSVAVNAMTVQKFGFMLEKDMPYQPSWFEKGMSCEGEKGNKRVDPVCFSHNGPDLKFREQVFYSKYLIFEEVNSSSADVIEAMARFKSPVTASILAHSSVWAGSQKTGVLTLNRKLKLSCQDRRSDCSAHAVLITGYDLDKKVFKFKNSWGENWGDEGYGSISFDYMDQMSPRKFLTGYISENAPEIFDNFIKKRKFFKIL